MTAKVILHPASCKYLSLGHPWITLDSFSNKFPKNDFFLIGVDERSRKEIALLINDPTHKNIKARLWSLNSKTWNEETDFVPEMNKRIRTSIEKRISSDLFSERDNLYLINGESDFLPGLLVLKLKNHILIQYYALFWKKVETELLLALKNQLSFLFPNLVLENIWIQERNFNQEKSIRSLNGETSALFTLKEFGLNYKILLNEHYDFGLYTDMSAIRKQMASYIAKGQSLLNLFSYTGAFSLFALQLGVQNVVSVDLSSKYLNWLDENLKLNPQLDFDKHSSINQSVEKALFKMIEERMKFETIICDPPSVSSDGEKTNSALKAYEIILPLMLKLLSKNGSLFVFLNTHTISFLKFEEKLKNIITHSEFKNLISIGKRFRLAEDCASLKGFHEGDYLKGFLLEFKNKG